MVAKQKNRTRNAGSRYPISKERTHPKATLTSARLTLRDYFLFNVIFDAFCLIQMVIVYYFLKEAAGLFFFFGMVMIGFLIVSAFDYFYERVPGRRLDQVEGI